MNVRKKFKFPVTQEKVYNFSLNNKFYYGISQINLLKENDCARQVQKWKSTYEEKKLKASGISKNKIKEKNTKLGITYNLKNRKNRSPLVLDNSVNECLPTICGLLSKSKWTRKREMETHL